MLVSQLHCFLFRLSFYTKIVFNTSKMKDMLQYYFQRFHESPYHFFKNSSFATLTTKNPHIKCGFCHYCYFYFLDERYQMLCSYCLDILDFCVFSEQADRVQNLSVNVVCTAQKCHIICAKSFDDRGRIFCIFLGCM